MKLIGVTMTNSKEEIFNGRNTKVIWSKRIKKIKEDQTGQRTTKIQIYNIMEMDAFDIINN